MNATKPTPINRTLAKKLLGIVDQGLCSGLGQPKPGAMCVEAAVCFALGLPHGDNAEECVAEAPRANKIAINDSGYWSSNVARAAGLRRGAIAQLGSKGKIDEIEFAKHLAELTIRVIVPIALRAAASVNPKHAAVLEIAAKECEKLGRRQGRRSRRNRRNRRLHSFSWRRTVRAGADPLQIPRRKMA